MHGNKTLKWDAGSNWISNTSARMRQEQLRYLLTTVLNFQNTVMIPAVVISSIGSCSFWGRLLCRLPNELQRFNSTTCCSVQKGCVCVCVCARTNTYQPSEVRSIRRCVTTAQFLNVCSYRIFNRPLWYTTLRELYRCPTS